MLRALEVSLLYVTLIAIVFIIIIIRTNSRRSVPRFTKIELLKVLDVTINNRLSYDRHITDILASCAQNMPPKAINTVFQAVVEAKLCYAVRLHNGRWSRPNQGLLSPSGEVRISDSWLSNLRSRPLDCGRPYSRKYQWTTVGYHTAVYYMIITLPTTPS